METLSMLLGLLRIVFGPLIRLAAIAILGLFLLSLLVGLVCRP